MCVRNLRFVALPVPEIIGVGLAKKIGAVPGYAHTLYPPKVLYTYHTDYLSMCTRFPAILDCSSKWGLRTPNLGDRGWYRSKERLWVQAVHSKFSSIFTRFRHTAAFVLQDATVFPTPPLVSPKFPHVPLGIGWSPFRYYERRCWANCLCN